MSKRIPKKTIILLLIPIFIGFSVILMGSIVIFTTENIIDKLAGGFIIAPGILVLFYSIRELKRYQNEVLIIKHDERSEKNRLKASEQGFRFYFASFSILILLYTLKVIDEKAFFALTGPIIAVGIILYYFGYYRFERN